MRLIESTTGNGAALADRGLQSDWEGIIVKRPDGRYASGNRGSGWQKLKFTRSEEFVVGGWTLPRGSRRHFGALLLGYYAAGEGPATGALVFAGQVGTGFTDAELDRIAGLLAPLETDVPPFVELAQPKPSEKRRWVEPVLVVQTGFSQWTPDGVLRHPVHQGLREDKRPADVRLPARRPPPARDSDPPARRAATRPAGRVGTAARIARRTAKATSPAQPAHPAPAPEPDAPRHTRSRGSITCWRNSRTWSATAGAAPSC